jgi:hypothetical protein
VFSPTGSYGPDPAPNVVELDYDDIAEFMRTDRRSLPRTVEFWVNKALGEAPGAGALGDAPGPGGPAGGTSKNEGRS